MANVLLPGTLFCLMVLQSLQDNGTAEEAQTKTNVTLLNPKTFNGRNTNPGTDIPASCFNLDGQPPCLDVSPAGPASAYIASVLSTRVIPAAYTLAMVVGIPSNIYILAFLRARAFSTVVFYLSLALSDSLLLLSLALRVHYHINGNHWVFGEYPCRIVTALFYGNVCCSAHTIACISVKRYLAVVRPFLYRRLPKTTLSVVACLGVWVLFGAAVVPELLVRQSYQVSGPNITTCHDVLPLGDDSHALLVPYRLALVCLGLIVPFLVCVCTHVAVVHKLGRSGCDWAPFVRVSTLVFLIFLVCFAPSGALHAAHYIRLFSGRDDGLYGYYRVAVCLCCFHSCLDPFLCVLMSKTAASKLQFISIRRRRQMPAIRI